MTETCSCGGPTRFRFIAGAEVERVRVCTECGRPSRDQRSPIQIAQEMSTAGGLTGMLFGGVADRLAKKR